MSELIEGSDKNVFLIIQSSKFDEKQLSVAICISIPFFVAANFLIFIFFSSNSSLCGSH